LGSAMTPGYPVIGPPQRKECIDEKILSISNNNFPSFYHY